MTLSEEFSEYRIMHVDTVENKVILGRTCYIKRDEELVAQSLDSKEVGSESITQLLADLLAEAKTLV
jgi:hypothetical protein